MPESLPLRSHSSAPRPKCKILLEEGLAPGYVCAYTLLYIPALTSEPPTQQTACYGTPTGHGYVLVVTDKENSIVEHPARNIK
jgi:hypothetical protein